MTTYLIDPTHSSINFSIKHMMIAKVRGGFEKFSGTLTYDAKNPEKTYVEATIETSSINTKETKRDTHLKSADFFNVAEYPHITFKSKKVILKNGELKIIGDLFIHGIIHSVTLNVEVPTDEIKDPWGNVRIGFSASTKIKRKDFGLNWNAAIETGGLIVGDEVIINLDVQFIKQV